MHSISFFKAGVTYMYLKNILSLNRSILTVPRRMQPPTDPALVCVSMAILCHLVSMAILNHLDDIPLAPALSFVLRISGAILIESLHLLIPSIL